MRAIALLLIIANLAYLGWATLIDTPPARPGIAELDPSIPSLMLATERVAVTQRAANLAASRPRTPPANTPDSPSQASPANVGCTSIGPFQDLSSAAQASAALKSSGRDSRQRLEQGQLWVGYWVSVPGFANREDAERAVAKLKQNGINDVYISLSGTEPGSAPTNIVSLGVFKESERAQRMLQEAKGLGFNAQISDRTRAGSVYWIDVELAGAGSDFDFSVLSSQPGKILRLEQRACPKSG